MQSRLQRLTHVYQFFINFSSGSIQTILYYLRFYQLWVTADVWQQACMHDDEEADTLYIDQLLVGYNIYCYDCRNRYCRYCSIIGFWLP